MKSILILEDGKGFSDSVNLWMGFKEINESLGFAILYNSENIMESLTRHIADKKQIIPDLIIIDVGSSCIELLKVLKSNNVYRRIPIIVLSSSSDKEYINNCYSHFANAVIIKPTEKERFKEIINEIDNFWFHRTRLSSIPK